MSQEALGPPETRPSASQDLGRTPVALGDGKVHFPPKSLRDLRAEVNLNSSLPFTGKLITKFFEE